MRTEPPVSVPRARGANPAATAAPDPALEPPGMRSSRHGLLGMPKCALRPVGSNANSQVPVLPMGYAPASRRRLTAVESRSGTKSAYTAEPEVVRTPLVQ